jgi:hypothetical protein
MAHRKLRADDGRDWEIWDVVPSTVARTIGDERSRRSREAAPRPAHFALPADLRNGWLAFQCGDESRRLAPIPDDWADCSETALKGLLFDAKAIPVRERLRNGDERSGPHPLPG